MARIMIVDDSIVMRKNLASILKQGGHTIVGEASNGRQAVSLYAELQPDIVTMDISMPIMGGVEAIKQIVSEHKNAKIVMISAVNQKKMVFSAINNGAKHYVVKPIDPQKLLNIIDEVLNAKEEILPEEEDDVFQTQQGFEIDNKDGKFVVHFNPYLDTKDHNLLSIAIRGILFIKPLHIEFNFNDIEDIDDLILEPILRLSQEVKDTGGEVTYIATSENMQKKIRKWV